MVVRINTTSVIYLPIRLDVLVCLLLVWATLPVYWQVKDHEFVNYDDDTYVTENYHLDKGWSQNDRFRLPPVFSASITFTFCLAGLRTILRR